MTLGRAEHRPARPLDAKRRARWCAVSARGVEADFIRRLGHGGLADPGDLADVLAEPEPDVTAAVPAWLEILVAAESAAERCSGAADLVERPPTAGHELDRLLAPLLEQARVLLTQRAPRNPHIAAVVADDLRDWLRRDLSRLAGPCVDTEFAAFRALTAGVTSDDLWFRFEQEALASGLFGIWDTYPVLARAVGVRVLDWVDRSAEMLDRFDADRVALAELLSISDAPRLEAVELTVSDPHNGHAQVAVCTVSGARVVYKPKDLSAEALLSELVGWSARIGMDLGPATDVLAREGYGWVGYVEQAPVDADGARRFYARIGRLAALLFALGGNDAHADNVVACGDAPVVIDAETVLQPTLPAEDGRRVVEWVLDGMLLPRWLRIAGTAIDLSATGAPGTTLRRTELHWRNLGTSQMELVPVPVEVGDFSSAVRSPTGDLYRPEDHAEEILSGFRQGWQQVCSHVSDFTGAGGWLDRLADVRVRVLVRMTRTYTRLLDTALDPNLLRSGVERSIHLDHLARTAFDRDAEQWLGLTDAERRMLEDGDVPFFSVRADVSALCSANGSVLIRFEESSLARARRRLALLDHQNLELQSEVVRAALAIAPTGCRSKSLQRAQMAPDRHRSEGDVDPAGAAGVVAARMSAQVMKFGGPSAPLSLVVASPSQWAIDVPGPGIYDGRIGVAVALAGGAAALDDPALAELARRVAEPLLEDAVARPRRLVLGHGLGAQEGIGGILLGLALLERLTRTVDSGLGAAFAALARAVTDDDVDSANPLDLFTGLPALVAGLAAGAQVGWETETSVGPLARRRLMDAVAAHLAAVESGAAAVRNGFAHGDAGLAAVLASVASLRAGASEEALALASALVAAESARFDPELGGWRDLSPGAASGGLGAGWCDGSPGVALSRTLVARCIPRSGASDHSSLVDYLVVDVRRACGAIEANRSPGDSLCCGTAGRVAVLRTISENSVLDIEERPRRRRMFQEATAALASAARGGGLCLGVPPSPLAPLGLFQGLGGILYALAQASRPDLPAVLAWGADLA